MLLVISTSMKEFKMNGALKLGWQSHLIQLIKGRIMLGSGKYMHGGASLGQHPPSWDFPNPPGIWVPLLPPCHAIPAWIDWQRGLSWLWVLFVQRWPLSVPCCPQLSFIYRAGALEHLHSNAHRHCRLAFLLSLRPLLLKQEGVGIGGACSDPYQERAW